MQSRVFPKKLHLIRFITSRFFVFTSFQTLAEIYVVWIKKVFPRVKASLLSLLWGRYMISKNCPTACLYENHIHTHAQKAARLPHVLDILAPSISIASLFLSAAQIFSNH